MKGLTLRMIIIINDHWILQTRSDLRSIRVLALNIAFGVISWCLSRQLSATTLATTT